MDDKAKIEAVMNKYTQGTHTRDVALLKSIFHENGVMTGWLGPDLLMGEPEPFYRALEAKDVGAGYTTETAKISIQGPMASAEVREKNPFGLNFVNRFHLIRQADESWVIV